MNQELKSRIAACKTRLADGNDELKTTSEETKSKINKFGKFRVRVLHDTVGRFKPISESLAQKIKLAEYDIPESMESPTEFSCELNIVEYSSDQLKRIGDGASSFVQNAGNIILQHVAKSRGKTFTPVNTPSAGGGNDGWIGLFVSICNMASAYAEKKAAEYTEVERYEAETEKQLKKIEAHIEFCDKIGRRLKELTDVSIGLKKRTVEQLEILEEITPIFDANNMEHVKIYQSARILVKGCSELAKVEILDFNHKLSEKDKEYIIKCKKLSNTEI